MKTMGDILKIILGALGSAVAFFTPIHPLIVLVFIFVGIDFITGVWASRKRAGREKRKWTFSSGRARGTVWKTVFYVAGIMHVWSIEKYVLTFVTLHLAKAFAGFVLGVEFFSFLENAADISDHPVFRRLRKFTAKELKDKAGIDIETAKEETAAAAQTEKT